MQSAAEVQQAAHVQVKQEFMVLFVLASRDLTYVGGPKLVALDQYPAFHEDSVPYLAFLKFGLRM
jgi:hypothetical protein